MVSLFNQHRALLDGAVGALRSRGFWTPFSEIPSGKIYGESAKDEGQTAYEARLGKPFALPDHPENGRTGAEVSPWGPELKITYPAATAAGLVEAAKTAGRAWGDASIEDRLGICLEALLRLNRRSFEIANATMHTTGQAFAMAFQAGGPHAQDRGLEALAVAYAEMTRTPREALWEKPQGKAAPLLIEKHWRVVPRGIGLVIGCNTFPTWNSYPALFANLATGNCVILKPHPQAILPAAITVEVLRAVLSEQGFDPNVVLLAADQQGQEITKDLAQHQDISIIDYTGSNAFGDWLRKHALQALIFTEEAGVNSIVIAATDDFDGMCANIAFSLSLYSGQMCTSPQDIFVPKTGIETNMGHKSFADVAKGIASAIDALLADPARASGVCGAIANPATLKRVTEARKLGTILRDSQALPQGRSATPLLISVGAELTATYEEERFGPISFIISVDNVAEAIERAASLARRKGAITASLYDTDDKRIEDAAEIFAHAGVNLSVNLTGNIFVNQSAAFSDYHVTGGNPAGNASLTDTAFIAGRFRLAMWRRPKAA